MTYEDFKKEALKISGINLDHYKEKQMKRRINSLIRKNRFSGYHDYICALKENKTLYNEFINYLTINVSEFYRNPEQWEVLKNDILPQLINKKSNIKIWSAACSTGEEPYTLAMVLNEYMLWSNNRINATIIATDIDKDAVDKAKEGKYTYKSIEKLPAEYLDKYFLPTGEYYKVKDGLKGQIKFEYLDLLGDQYPKNCDIIICRNVIIYFTEKAKRYVYLKLSQALNPGGILFVGSTEQIIMPQKYNLTSVRTFFYAKVQ
jgi:chemotaxis protein methyltransferase CheR